MHVLMKYLGTVQLWIEMNRARGLRRFGCGDSWIGIENQRSSMFLLNVQA